MFSSKALWFVSASVLLTSFGFTQTSVQAQTTFPFNTEYDIFATAKDLTPNLQQISLEAFNTNAPYGLSKVNSLSYSQTNFTTGEYSFSTDPAAFGLQNLPSGFVTFSGNGDDKLFGTQTGAGLIDFNSLTVKSNATVNITGGDGRFKGATGTFVSSQVQPFNIQLGVALKGNAQISGSFKTIPEPGNAITLLGLGLIGTIGIIRRRLSCPGAYTLMN